MITAAEAKELYVKSAYTPDEIEEKIRKQAASQDFAVFDRKRISNDLIGELESRGFRIQRNSTDVIVNW